MRNFVARIFGKTEEEFQDVFCYITWDDGREASIGIKMELYVDPSDIRSDVQTALWESYGNLSIDTIEFQLAPTNVTIHP